MSKVRLISISPDAEKIIGYCARVSNPGNQDNPNVAGLIKYCMRHGHWSIFEMANMVVEIETSRAISAQILRHRSFSFQEFSQRYAAVQSFEPIEIRRQDDKNRQNSIDDLSEEDKDWFYSRSSDILEDVEQFYQECLDRKIAKECARFILPMTTTTRLYMNGTIRSWIHYLNLRQGSGTQLEHIRIAEAIKDIFIDELPVVSEALGWGKKKPEESTNSETSGYDSDSSDNTNWNNFQPHTH